MGKFSPRQAQQYHFSGSEQSCNNFTREPRPLTRWSRVCIEETFLCSGTVNLQWLCGISWLPTAKIPFHLSSNTYRFRGRLSLNTGWRTVGEDTWHQPLTSLFMHVRHACYLWACACTHTHMCMHAYACAYIQTRAYMHVHIYAPIHTYIPYTHMYTQKE